MTSLLTPPATGAPSGSAPAVPGALRLLEPLPGFADVDFTLSDIDPDGLLLALRATRDPGLRFVLTPATTFFDGYRPALPAQVVSALGAGDQAQLRLLVLLTITSDLYDATANLRAPLVVSADGATAIQVVLDDDTLSMREPIMPTVVPD